MIFDTLPVPFNRSQCSRTNCVPIALQLTGITRDLMTTDNGVEFEKILDIFRNKVGRQYTFKFATIGRSANLESFLDTIMKDGESIVMILSYVNDTRKKHAVVLQKMAADLYKVYNLTGTGDTMQGPYVNVEIMFGSNNVNLKSSTILVGFVAKQSPSPGRVPLISQVLQGNVELVHYDTTHRSSSDERSSKRIKRGGSKKLPVVHVGPRGGQYVVVGGCKRYISV